MKLPYANDSLDNVKASLTFWGMCFSGFLS